MLHGITTSPCWSGHRRSTTLGDLLISLAICKGRQTGHKNRRMCVTVEEFIRKSLRGSNHRHCQRTRRQTGVALVRLRGEKLQSKLCQASAYCSSNKIPHCSFPHKFGFYYNHNLAGPCLKATDIVLSKLYLPSSPIYHSLLLWTFYSSSPASQLHAPLTCSPQTRETNTPAV